MTISDKLDYISNAKVNRKQMEYICEIDQEVNMLKRELQRKDNNWNELKKWLNEPQITFNLDANEFGIEKIECVSVKDILDKIKELESK